MDFNTLYEINPDLVLDGIVKEDLDDSIIPGHIPVGPNQPNEIVTSFVGGPYLPDNSAFNPNTLSGVTFGASGSYPKPFLSYGQRLTNANYSYLGPYAKIKKFIDSTCEVNAGLSGCSGNPGISGRLGIIPSGIGMAQYGFFYSPWINHDDGYYGPAFWSERSNLDPPIPTKSEWWDQCSKTTVLARLYNHPLRPWVIVEIAYQYTNFDADQYFKGPDATSLGDASLDMLVVMAGIAAAVRWL